MLRQRGARIQLTRANTSLGRLALMLGRLDEAERILQANLQEESELGTPTGMAWTLSALGKVKHLQGNYQQAQNYYQQCLSLSKENQPTVCTSTCIVRFG